LKEPAESKVPYEPEGREFDNHAARGGTLAARTTIRISLEAVATAPANRRMDLSAVRDLMLYAPQPLHVGEFYITRIWLE
jgi:hypothetical protein